MPESAYDFKLTPPPASMSKKDVTAFLQNSFDRAIEKVSKLTPAQLSKTYTSDEGIMSGLELLMGMLDHTTRHRASAEMYLRAAPALKMVTSRTSRVSFYPYKEQSSPLECWRTDVLEAHSGEIPMADHVR